MCIVYICLVLLCLHKRTYPHARHLAPSHPYQPFVHSFAPHSAVCVEKRPTLATSALPLLMSSIVVYSTSITELAAHSPSLQGLSIVSQTYPCINTTYHIIRLPIPPDSREACTLTLKANGQAEATITLESALLSSFRAELAANGHLIVHPIFLLAKNAIVPCLCIVADIYNRGEAIKDLLRKDLTFVTSSWMPPLTLKAGSSTSFSNMLTDNFCAAETCFFPVVPLITNAGSTAQHKCNYPDHLRLDPECSTDSDGSDASSSESHGSSVNLRVFSGKKLLYCTSISLDRGPVVSATCLLLNKLSIRADLITNILLANYFSPLTLRIPRIEPVADTSCGSASDQAPKPRKGKLESYRHTTIAKSPFMTRYHAMYPDVLLIGHRGTGSNNYHPRLPSSQCNIITEDSTTSTSAQAHMLDTPLSAFSTNKRTNLAVHHVSRGSDKLIGEKGINTSEIVPIQENSLMAFEYCWKSGCQYAELDIILTRDMVPVINHNFVLNNGMFNVPVSQLTADEFSNFMNPRMSENQVDSVSSNQKNTLGKRGKNHDQPLRENLPGERTRCSSFTAARLTKSQSILDADLELLESLRVPPMVEDVNVSYSVLGDSFSTYTTLAEVFRRSPEDLGFNLEIKYPTLYSKGFTYYTREVVIASILSMLTTYFPSRRVYFSSFDPQICSILKLKQSIYPVYLLNLGEATNFTEFDDVNMNDGVQFSVFNGIRYCNSHCLDGMVVSINTLPCLWDSAGNRVLSRDSATDVRSTTELLNGHRISFLTYGTEAIDTASVQRQVAEGCQGIIFDLVISKSS